MLIAVDYCNVLFDECYLFSLYHHYPNLVFNQIAVKINMQFN